MALKARKSEEPEELMPDDEQRKREEFYNARLRSRQDAMTGREPGARFSQEQDSDSIDKGVGSMVGLGPEDEAEDVKGKDSEQRVSSRLEMLKSRNQKMAREAALGRLKAARAVKRYKTLKRVVRAVKLGSLAGTSLGDVFVSLSVLFLSINGELVLKLFVPDYPIDKLDIAILAVGWLLIGVVVFAAYILVSSLSSLNIINL